MTTFKKGVLLVRTPTTRLLIDFRFIAICAALYGLALISIRLLN